MIQRALLFFLALVVASAGRAVIVAGPDGTINTSAPPDGAPWDHVGTIGGASGVFLGSYGGGDWVITANHVGLGNFTLNSTTYTAIGGSGVQIGGADLLVFQISSGPLLPNLALSASAPGLGASVTMIGNGVNRDATLLNWSVNTSGNPWIWTSLPDATGANASGYAWGSGNALRWGTDQISGATVFNNTSLLSTTFDAPTGATQGASGDSGGGVFYNNGSTWELAGVMAYIGTYNSQPGSTAVFGNTTESVDISHYRSAILTAIPEPSTYAALAGLTALGFTVYRRRRGKSI
jgi:hypothetical protein